MDKSNVKSTTAKIIHENVGVLSPVVQSISHRRSIRLINNLFYLEAGSFCSADGSFTFL